VRSTIRDSPAPRAIGARAIVRTDPSFKNLIVGVTFIKAESMFRTAATDLKTLDASIRPPPPRLGF